MAKDYSPGTRELIARASRGDMSLKDGDVPGIPIAPGDEKIANCYKDSIVELLNNGAKVVYLNRKIKPLLYNHEVKIEGISFRAPTVRRVWWGCQRLVNRIKSFKKNH